MVLETTGVYPRSSSSCGLTDNQGMAADAGGSSFDAVVKLETLQANR